MITIHKHAVFLGDTFTIELPEGSTFLSLQIQHGKPQMWFRVDDSRPMRRQVFGVCGTGSEIPPQVSSAPFLGTFQMEGGSLILHVFGGIYA